MADVYELESLVTKVILDPTGFNQGAAEVEARIDKLQKHIFDIAVSTSTALDEILKIVFRGFSDTVDVTVDAIVAGAAKAAKGITPLSDAVGVVKTDFVAMGTAGKDLGVAFDGLKLPLDRFKSLVDTTAGASLKGAVISIGELTLVMERLVKTGQPLTGLDASFGAFAATLKTAAADIDNTTMMLSLSLSRVGKFFEGAAQVKPARLNGLIAPLENFAGEFKRIAGSFAGEAVSSAAQALGRVGNFAEAIKTFKYDPKAFDDLRASIRAISRTLNAAGKLTDIEAGTKAVERLAAFVRATANTNPAGITSLVQPISNLMDSLAKMPSAQALDSAKVLTRLHTALKNLSTITPAPVIAAANAVAQAMSIINAVPLGAGAARVASVLGRIGVAMKNIAVANATAGGAPPNFFGGLLTTLGNIPPAANRTASAVAGINNQLRATNNTANDLVATLTSMKVLLSFYGFFAGRQFAEFDTALIRASAHMADYDQVNRAAFRMEAIKRSGDTSLTATDMAKGLDILAASGMSAGMAIQSLATAQNLALASGMSLEDSARKLTQSTNSMGLAVEDVGQHYANLNKMADLIVGVSHRVGANESAIFEGFTLKFAGAARRAGMSMEDSVAVLGLMARSGSGMQGRSQGGNITAKAISEITEQSMIPGQRQQWARILGQDVRDATGRMLPMLDILELMAKRLHAVGTDAFEADLTIMGFGKDAKMALEPLLNAAGGARELRDSMVKMGGAAKIVADMVNQGFGATMQRVWNNVVNVSMVVAERVAPALYAITQPLVGMMQWFTRLNPAWQSFIVLLGAGTLAIYPAMIAFRSLTSVMSSIALAPLAGIRLAWRTLSDFVGWIRGAFSSIASIPSRLVSAFSTLGTYLASPFVTMWQAAKTAGSLVGSLATTVWQSFMSPFTLMTYVAKNAVHWMGRFSDLMFNISQHGTDAFLALVKQSFLGLISITISLVSWLVMIPLIFAAIAGAAAILWPVMITGLAAVGAVVATASVAVYQMARFVGGALVAAWGAVRVAAADSLGWVGSKVAEINKNASSIWERMRSGALAFRDAFVGVLTPLVGFFWNFRHNMVAIWEFFGEHGEQAFQDIGEVAFNLIEVIAGNAATLARAIGGIIGEAFNASLQTVMTVLDRLFGWVHQQFPYLMHDLGILMGVFFDNLRMNFYRLYPVIDALANYLTNRIFADPINPSSDLIARSKKADRDRIDLAFSLLKKQGLRGPLDGLEDVPERDFRFDRDLYGLRNIFKGVDDIWLNAGETMAASFAGHMLKMNPILGAFKPIMDSPIWKGLLSALNLSVPDDAMVKLLEAYKAIIKPMDGKEDTGMAMGTGGAGFQLKQTSMERFLYTGATAELLEFQQLTVMQQIKKDTGIIATQRGAFHKETVKEVRTSNLLHMPKPILEE